MKRGISPLIATVLLIGMVVIITVLIAGVDIIQNPLKLVEPYQEEVKCSEVNVKLREICYKDTDNPGEDGYGISDELHYVIENKEKEISKFLINLYKEGEFKQAWVGGLKPFDINSFFLTREDVDNIDSFDSLKEVKIIPFIIYGEKEISCDASYAVNNQISCCVGSLGCGGLQCRSNDD